MTHTVHSPWISAPQLAELTGINRRSANRLLNAFSVGRPSPWRGSVLEVREVKGRGGQSGMSYEVRVSSLPAAYQARLKASSMALQLPVPLPGASPKSALVQANWWTFHLRYALEAEPGSPERAKAIADLADIEVMDWRGQLRSFSRSRLYQKLAAIEEYGMAGAVRKARSDMRQARTIVARDYDAATQFPRQVAEALRDALRLKVRGLVNAGATRGVVIRIASQWLCDQTVARGFAAVDETAFTRLCGIAVRRLYEQEKPAGDIVYRRYHDRKRSDDAKPRIRRAPPSLPAECYVLDVHHTNVLVRGENGKIGTAKLMACVDWATRRITGEFVFFELRGGVNNLDNIEMMGRVFTDAEQRGWGIPEKIYQDNGKEYRFTRFLDQMMRLNTEGFGIGLPIRTSQIIKALPYNGAAKVIEYIFHILNDQHFRFCQGFIGDDRMNPMEVTPGKLAKPFGSFTDFCDFANGVIDQYNKTPQQGHLAGDSPNGRLQKHIDAGWRPTVLDPQHFDSVFVEREARTIRAGSIKVDNRIWTCPELHGFMGTQVTACIPWRHGFNELRIEDAYGHLIGYAQPDVIFNYDDPRGAQASASRVSTRNAAVRAHRASAPKTNVADEQRQWAHRQPPAPVVLPVGKVSVALESQRAIVPGKRDAKARDQQIRDEARMAMRQLVAARRAAS